MSTGHQFSHPIFLPDARDARGVVLEQIDVGGGGEAEQRYSEKFIQDLAFSHPEVLPVQEIDRAVEGLVPICREPQFETRRPQDQDAAERATKTHAEMISR